MGDYGFVFKDNPSNTVDILLPNISKSDRFREEKQATYKKALPLSNCRYVSIRTEDNDFKLLRMSFFDEEEYQRVKSRFHLEEELSWDQITSKLNFSKGISCRNELMMREYILKRLLSYQASEEKLNEMENELLELERKSTLSIRERRIRNCLLYRLEENKKLGSLIRDAEEMLSDIKSCTPEEIETVNNDLLK